ncbi:MAG: type II secretion system protein GspG [Planctomycetaceae bacterium]|nr:type II secretion system protein GspG [Planctomycetaceae bacterium]
MKVLKTNVRRGFTLMELIIVLAILVILMAVLVPPIMSRWSKSNINAADLQIKTFEGLLKDFYIDTQTYPTTEQGLIALRIRPEIPAGMSTGAPGGNIPGSNIPGSVMPNDGTGMQMPGNNTMPNPNVPNGMMPGTQMPGNNTMPNPNTQNMGMPGNMAPQGIPGSTGAMPSGGGMGQPSGMAGQPFGGTGGGTIPGGSPTGMSGMQGMDGGMQGGMMGGDMGGMSGSGTMPGSGIDMMGGTPGMPGSSMGMTGSTGPNLEALKALAAKNAHDKWKGPYIDSDIPSDPWGHPYQYEYPTDKTSDGRPAIWSLGPDVKDDSDDIRNYKPEETKMLKEQQLKIQQERMQNMQNATGTGSTLPMGGDMTGGGSAMPPMGGDMTGGGSAMPPMGGGTPPMSGGSSMPPMGGTGGGSAMPPMGGGGTFPMGGTGGM